MRGMAQQVENADVLNYTDVQTGKYMYDVQCICRRTTA